MTLSQYKLLTLDQLISVLSDETGYFFRVHHREYVDIFVRTLENDSLYLYVDAAPRREGFYIQINFLRPEQLASFTDVLRELYPKISTGTPDRSIWIDLAPHGDRNIDLERLRAILMLRDVVLLLKRHGLIRNGNNG